MADRMTILVGTVGQGIIRSEDAYAHPVDPFGLAVLAEVCRDCGGSGVSKA